MRWSRNPEADLVGLALSAEEGFVLSRLDAPLTREEIVELTGLPGDRIDRILSLLEDKEIVISDTPSMRPAMETIPDLDDEDRPTTPPVADDDDDDPPTLERVVALPAVVTPLRPPPVVLVAPPVAAVDPLRQMLLTEPMTDLFTLATHGDVPEASRVIAGEVLREKYGASTPEDRAALIFATEAQVLTLGYVLDSRTASILCTRPCNSVLFVRYFARLAGCPPQLLAHLARQPLVKRDSQLRQLLLRHPNMPGDAKRRG